MPLVSSHTPGAFCWVELATTDRAAGVAFYRALLGWDVRDTPVRPPEFYSTFLIDSAPVAAAYRLEDDERAMGIPSHWNLYVNVEDADAIAARTIDLGGVVLVPPFDVLQHGRMAVLQDPAGGTFHVWQAKAHIGSRRMREAGTLCWSELMARHPEKVTPFYTALFGWTARRLPDASTPYTEFLVGSEHGIGMVDMPASFDETVPSFWLPYFQVDDLDASAAKARDLGATLVIGPYPVPGTGRLTIHADPQGALFALFDYDNDQP